MRVIKEKLIKKNYTASIINRITKQVKRKESSLSENSNNTQNLTDLSYVSAPYIRGTSEKAARVLQKHNIKLCHKPANTIKNQVCFLKDKRNNLDKAGVVYGLGCNECDVVYVGETGRQVKDRMQEHRKDVERKKQASKISNHVEATGHSFDFENVSVLDSCSSAKTRRLLEGVHTALRPNSINRAIQLPESYFAILNFDR